MRKKNIIVSAILVCLIVVILSTVAFACNSVNTPPTPTASAEILDESGNILEVIDVKTNTEVIRQYRSGGAIYATTYTIKPSSDSAYLHGVTITQTITWSDNFGPDNGLVTVSGNWATTTESIYDRRVGYGAVDVDGNVIDSFTKYPSDNSFSYSPTGVTGYGFYLNTYAKISGYDDPITLYVKTSVLD